MNKRKDTINKLFTAILAKKVVSYYARMQCPSYKNKTIVDCMYCINYSICNPKKYLP
jgi:hypothetical protein